MWTAFRGFRGLNPRATVCQPWRVGRCNPKGWQRVAGGRNGVETSGLGEKKPVHPEGVTEGRADADWQFQA